MNKSLRTDRPPLLGTRLSIMMFLQYAIWGAWLPLLWPFLSGHHEFSSDEIGDMLAVGAIGALVAPFIAGQVADRYFATQKFLGISHILGGILVWQLATLETYASFLLFSLLYSLIYSPTLSLTNSLAFHHLPDRDRDFGRVRVWGTVGWIAVGIGIGQWLLYRHSPENAEPAVKTAAEVAGMADAFRLSAILGLLMGIYCFLLPNTPPCKGARKSATLAALMEIRKRPLLILFILAVPISCIHQFYFVHTAGFLGSIQTDTAESINNIFGVGGGGLMTVGQMSELAVLALIPLVAKKLSRKSLLAIGTAAYALRMYLFAHYELVSTTLGLPEMAIIIPGIALHGLCFGCWIFVAFMIVDEETTGDVRASAQSLFNFVIIGIGIILGSKIAGRVMEEAELGETIDYTFLFEVPMYASIGCLLILAVLYPGKRKHSAT